MEIWKIIDEFPNYQISNLGNIKNSKGKILKPHANKKGYLYVCLSKKCKLHNCQIHRLVAKAFIENPLNKPCVNHIDFNPSNNHLENLQWVTHSENCLWSRDNISASHKGKVKSVNHRKAIRKSMLNLENSKHYIYKTKTGYMFRFRPSKNEDINKTFKTIEQAIEYRNNYFKEHKEYVIE